MIAVEKLSVEFAARPLFTEASFVVNDNDRIALVGKNGAGKSTLLKILSGIQRPTSGSVNYSAGLRVGYLPQVMVIQDDTTVREETRKAFAEHMAVQEQLKALEKEMAERTDYESQDYLALIEKYTTAHDRFELMGGERYEGEMERTLMGLGFTRTDFDRKTSEFSGGWRMRIELAKILLMQPDVLLLDEPTNHLDIESIQWLEQLLVQRSKAVVLVSHDRAFINSVSNRTLEISCGKIYDFKVKYDDYVVLRAEQREQQLRAYQNQQKEIADIKDFIERFRYKPTKAVQVQSRIKQLEKIVPIEVDEVDRTALRLRFPPCLRSGDFPIICEEVRKVYGEHTVFHNVNLTIRRGEKVAFVGKNGEGKSTLVKCIMGEIPFEGQLTVGHNVQPGYFAQNQAQLLDEELTVFDTIDRVATGEVRLRINDILGAFMFGGEASEKKVKVLSGGERSRLAMIRLLLEPVNLLILDEPTNHLDMDSKNVLKEAIKAFDGTAIIVSHDRDFLDGLVSKVYEFGGGVVREHLGGIYDFIRTKSTTAGMELSDKTAVESAGLTVDALLQSPSATKTSQPDAKAENGGVTNGKEDYQQRKERMKKLSRHQKAMASCEEKIARLESRLQELNDRLCMPENASNMALVNEYTAMQDELNALNEQWLTEAQTVEELQNDII